VTVLISRTLLFGLNVTLTLIFSFIVMLSYRVIHMFSYKSLIVPWQRTGTRYLVNTRR